MQIVAPLVSVIVPVFNHAAYIGACLDSISGDGYSRVELVLIDDGSNDGSFDLAAEWVALNQAGFVRTVLRRQNNVGITCTLNRLLHLARGDFIVLLASDDALLPGGIAARVTALLQHPEWLAVFGDCTIIDRDGHQTHASGLVDLNHADKAALLNSATILTELLWRWSVPGPVLMARREAFFGPNSIGLYPEDIRVEDRYFYLSALLRKAIGFVDYPVASYRLHGMQAITASKGQVEEDLLTTELRLLPHFRGLNALGLWLRTRRPALRRSSSWWTKGYADACWWLSGQLSRVLVRLNCRRAIAKSAG
jgi:glycosyltransferase involved in cell wall biosynthesis